jgi:hypothetical protein
MRKKKILEKSRKESLPYLRKTRVCPRLSDKDIAKFIPFSTTLTSTHITWNYLYQISGPSVPKQANVTCSACDVVFEFCWRDFCCISDGDDVRTIYCSSIASKSPLSV